MAVFKTGDIMDVHHEYHGCYFTASGTLNSRGELVMGKGFSLCVRRHFPQLPAAIGHAIQLLGCAIFEPKGRRYKGVYGYGLIPCDTAQSTNDHYLTIDEGGWLPRSCQSRRWGAFQTQAAFWDPVSLSGLELSVQALTSFAKRNKSRLYALNYPSIEPVKKRLFPPLLADKPALPPIEITRAAIEPLLAALPDNIHVYSLDTDTREEAAA